MKIQALLKYFFDYDRKAIHFGEIKFTGLFSKKQNNLVSFFIGAGHLFFIMVIIDFADLILYQRNVFFRFNCAAAQIGIAKEAQRRGPAT